MSNGQLPAEEWYANLFGVLDAILYQQVSRDMSPNTQAVALSTAQDAAVTTRADFLVRAARQRVMPSPPTGGSPPGVPPLPGPTS